MNECEEDDELGNSVCKAGPSLSYSLGKGLTYAQEERSIVKGRDLDGTFSRSIPWFTSPESEGEETSSTQRHGL